MPSIRPAYSTRARDVRATPYRVIMASQSGRRGRGGIASLVSYLADALPVRLSGVQVDVLDTYGPGTFWLMPLFFGVAIIKLTIARLCRRVDLVHIHMSCYGSAVRKPVLALAATLMGLPTVMHLHGADFDEYVRTRAPWQRNSLIWVLRRCVRVVVIGSHWREVVVKELGLDPNRVVLIHNGAPASAPRERRSPRKVGALLMLGELGDRKGTPTLIAALAMPELRQIAWTATFAGNGPVDQFRATVRSLELSDHIEVLGWQSRGEVSRLLTHADILVLPSYAEGLPMAILEAMAAGVAIISTPVGAIPDAIVHNETGLLVPPGNAAALANAIRRLLEDPPLRERLAAGALIRFEQLFTIEHTVDRVADLYRNLGLALLPAQLGLRKSHSRLTSPLSSTEEPLTSPPQSMPAEK